MAGLLYAIGIYSIRPKQNGDFPRYTRILSAPEPPGINFFQSSNQVDELNSLVEQTIPKLPAQLEPSQFVFRAVPEEKEYHYVVCIPQNKLNPELFSTDLLLCLVANKRLESIEAANLLINIIYIINRHAVAKEHTLQSILMNPLGYTGKDLKIQKINDGLADLKQSLFNNFDLLVQRGEKLEDLQNKAETVHLEAIKFKKAANQYAGLPCCRF